MRSTYSIATPLDAQDLPPGKYKADALYEITDDAIKVSILNIRPSETSEPERSEGEEGEGLPQPVGVIESIWVDQERSFACRSNVYQVRVRFDSSSNGTCNCILADDPPPRLDRGPVFVYALADGQVSAQPPVPSADTRLAP